MSKVRWKPTHYGQLQESDVFVTGAWDDEVRSCHKLGKKKQKPVILCLIFQNYFPIFKYKGLYDQSIKNIEHCILYTFKQGKENFYLPVCYKVLDLT